MPDSIILAEYAGSNADGEPEFSSEVAVDGRVDYRTRIVRNINGETIVSTATITLSESPGFTVKPNSFLRLPDGSEPVIISVDRAHDEDGTYVERIYT